MKIMYALTALSLIAVGSAVAQTAPQDDICVTNQAANAAVIARAQAAPTAAARKAILKAAIDANPRNAVCIADLALQMTQAANINPAAGPEEFGLADIGAPATTVPAENPNQLNQGSEGPSASPVTPAL